MSPRSALLRDVPHGELEVQLGNYVEAGWRIVQVTPCSQLTTRDPQGRGSVQTTHWLVVLEREMSASDPVELRDGA